MKEQNVLTDEMFYINELNHYTNCYFDCLRKLQFANVEDRDYLECFRDYCKEHVYYFAENLAKLKGVE